MGWLEGKVAFISGVARGQGRAHAVRLAREGADIIGFDICADIGSMDYPNASRDDLAETIRLVEAQDRRIIGRVADVRDYAQVESVFNEGMAAFGRVDVVVANAGIIRLGEDIDPFETWKDVIDTNLTGVWHTGKVAIPSLIEAGRGGSIIITSSSAGLKGTGTLKAGGAAYTAAKRGLVGLMQVWANALAPHMIRVNTIHPTGVVSGMTMNSAMEAMVAAGGAELSSMQNALPIPILQPEDIANAVAWLSSPEAMYLTGVQLPVDAGFAVR